MKAYRITNPQSLSSRGFFHDLFLTFEDSHINIEWLQNSGDAYLVDFAYYFQHSGDKTVSPIIDVCYNKDTETLEGTLAIAQSFWKLYGESLQNEWNNFTATYSPVQPYDVTEETEYEHEGTDGDEYSGTITNAHSGHVIDTRSDTDNNVETKLYGFTGETAVPSDIVTTESKNDREYRNDNVTKTLANGRSGSEHSEDTLTVHKYGNLGVIDKSTLLQRDIDLWKQNFFITILFPKVDEYLTLPIY